MNYPKLFFVFSVFFLLFGGLYAQDKTVTGVVTDESKTPLIGVSVRGRVRPAAGAGELHGDVDAFFFVVVVLLPS